MSEKEILKKFAQVENLLGKQSPEKALKIIARTRDALSSRQKWFLGRSYFWEQLCYKHLSEEKKALAAGGKALEIFESLGEEVEVSKVLRDMGLVYEYTRKYARAKPFLNKAIEKVSDNQAVLSFGVSISKLGQVCLKNGEVEKAKKLIPLGYNILNLSKNTFFKLTALLSYISLEIEGENYLSALEKIERAEALLKALNKEKGEVNERRLGEVYLKKSLVYMNLNNGVLSLKFFKSFAKYCLGTSEKERKFFVKGRESKNLIKYLKPMFPSEIGAILRKYSL